MSRDPNMNYGQRDAMLKVAFSDGYPTIEEPDNMEPLTPAAESLRRYLLDRARFAEGGAFDREVCARLAALTRPSDALGVVLDRWAAWIVRENEPRTDLTTHAAIFDWACRECVQGKFDAERSITPGFRCVPHEAATRLESK